MAQQVQLVWQLNGAHHSINCFCYHYHLPRHIVHLHLTWPYGIVRTVCSFASSLVQSTSVSEGRKVFCHSFPSFAHIRDLLLAIRKKQGDFFGCCRLLFFSLADDRCERKNIKFVYMFISISFIRYDPFTVGMFCRKVSIQPHISIFILSLYFHGRELDVKLLESTVPGILFWLLSVMSVHCIKSIIINAYIYNIHVCVTSPTPDVYNVYNNFIHVCQSEGLYPSNNDRMTLLYMLMIVA